MITTRELITKYVEDHLKEYGGDNWGDIWVADYKLHGDLLRIGFTYNPGYEWNKDYTAEDIIEVNLLDYITWVFNYKE